jgi:hypothetical protein
MAASSSRTLRLTRGAAGQTRDSGLSAKTRCHSNAGCTRCRTPATRRGSHVLALLLPCDLGPSGERGSCLLGRTVIETVPVDETVVLAAGTEGNPCSFDVRFDNHGTFRFATFLDSSGTPVRKIALSLHFEEIFSANGNATAPGEDAPSRDEGPRDAAKRQGAWRGGVAHHIGIVARSAKRCGGPETRTGRVSISCLRRTTSTPSRRRRVARVSPLDPREVPA